MQTANEIKNPTHRASLNGATVTFHADDFDAVVSDLVEKHGPGVPDVKPILTPELRRAVATKAVAETLATLAPVLKTGQYDAAGDKRSQTDRDAAIAAGFAPKQPVYRQGLRAEGMRRFREEFDAMPLARHAASRLINRVQSEDRQDRPFPARQVRVNSDGLLALNRARLLFTGRAFSSLVARLGMPAGAGTYLPAIEPELRAINVNHWVAGPFGDSEQLRAFEAQEAKKEFAPTDLVFRTRLTKLDPSDDAPARRECYGVVSGSYGEFDADKIAEAVRMSVPEDARARIDYDGHRTKIDVVFFSNIVPEHAVAGEFFQAAVQIRSDDAGGGSIVVSAALHQNLCLNFIILDKAVGEVARIRHIGSTEKLAEKFRDAFAQALKKIEHFTKAWGYAQEEDAAARALAAAKQTGQIDQAELENFVVRPVAEVLPWVFNGIIERELVPLPKKNRAETVAQLMTMWEKDESAATRARDTLLTRAAVVNALTRYAHEVNEDPFLESEIESAAGSLLFGRKDAAPAPLPFVPLTA
jgi:hypothetical protein